MSLGPYASFIVAAYSLTLAVVAALVLWVFLDHRTQRRILADLEASGPRGRSQAP